MPAAPSTSAAATTLVAPEADSPREEEAPAVGVLEVEGPVGRPAGLQVATEGEWREAPEVALPEAAAARAAPEVEQPAAAAPLERTVATRSTTTAIARST